MTWDQFAWALGLVLVFIGLNWGHTYWSDQTLHRRLSNQGRRLDDYKLEVSDKYASVAHLKEVEGRLVEEIKGLRTDIRALTAALTTHQSGGAAAKNGS